MHEHAYRNLFHIRTHLAGLFDWLQRWTSWDSREWDNGLHRRDHWG